MPELTDGNAAPGTCDGSRVAPNRSIEQAHSSRFPAIIISFTKPTH